MPMLSLKFRMEPRRAQSDAVDAMFGALCDLYNAALQQRIEAYQRRGISLRCGNRSITAFFGGVKKPRPSRA
jgi:putative transposase